MPFSDDFKKKIDDDYQARMQNSAQDSAQSSLQQQSPQPTAPQERPYETPDTPVRMQGDISEEEQIRKFGGPIGSQKYYEAKAQESVGGTLLKRTLGPIAGGAVAGFAVGGPFGAVIGAGLGGGVASNLMPDQEVWDSMSTTDKVSHIGYRTVEFPVKLAASLPAFFVKAVPNLVSFVTRPIQEKVSPFTMEGVKTIAEKEAAVPYDIPLAGKLDPLYGRIVDEYTNARQLGWGDNVSSVYAYLQGGVEIVNNALVGQMFAKGLRGIVKPPKRLAPGETISETAPIEERLRLSEEKLLTEAGRKKDGSASIRQSVSKEFEKEVSQKTGRSGRVYFKITPAGENSVEIALVQAPGIIQKIKDRFGAEDKNAVKGEVKIQSTIVKIEAAGEKAEAPAQGVVAGEARKITAKADEFQIGGRGEKISYTERGAREESVQYWEEKIKVGERPPVTVGRASSGNRVVVDGNHTLNAYKNLGIDEIPIIEQSPGAYNLARSAAVEKPVEFQGLTKEQQAVVEQQTPKAEKPFIEERVKPISEPYPGSENNPITRLEVENLSNIGKMNGFDPAVKDAIVRMMTGKSVVGDLTKAEYVRVAKTLMASNRLGEFSAGGQASLWTRYAGQKISPARSWMEALQRKTNIPIYDTWLDLENGVRFSRMNAQAYMEEGRTIFGEYAKDKNTDLRRLVDAHMHGDKGAIINNKNITPEIKADLLKIVDGVSSFFEKSGVEMGVPKEIYKKNAAGYYLPDIIDLGGIITKYKKGSDIPEGKTFFAKEKKKGGDYIRVDDPLKLMDIYAKQGSEAKFLDDAVSRAHTLNKEKIPKEFQESFRSAVLEKLGYEGGFTEFLDTVTARIAQKLNRNIPQDMGRKINQGMLTYAYFNALNSPATWIRNELMNNVMLYQKWGGEYWAQAKLKALSPEGMAEVRAAGFLNETQQAFGADIGTLTGKMEKAARVGLAPVGMADSLGRATAYFDTKLNFENAVKLYNEGKITWDKAEKMLDLEGMSPIEANRVRKAIISGDTKGAFQELVRSVIDETNFPYRKGSSARITFGTGGNIATFLYKWNIEFTHTMGRMLRTGQYNKLIRYYAASMVTVKSIQDAYDIDFSKTVGMGPLEARYPASVQIGLDFVNTLMTVQQGNAEAIDDAKDQLVRNLKTFGMPGGVDAKNWQEFWRSYSKGADKNGKYSIYGPKGDLIAESVPFSEIWGRLWGLPTGLKVETSKAERAARGYQYEFSIAKRKVAELRNAGKDDEADALVLQWEAKGEDVEPGARSYERFEIPRPERIFESLPEGAKELFEKSLLK